MEYANKITKKHKFICVYEKKCVSLRVIFENAGNIFRKILKKHRYELLEF